VYHNPLYTRFKYTFGFVIIFGIYYFVLLPLMVKDNNYHTRWEVKAHLFFPVIYVLLSILQIKSGLPIYSASRLVSKNDESLNACRLTRHLLGQKADPAV
jgi:hypothetical protein